MSGAGDTTPIWISCEGAGSPGHGDDGRSAMCAMCGAFQPAVDGVVLRHKRQDILAMIDRGDFDGG